MKTQIYFLLCIWMISGSVAAQLSEPFTIRTDEESDRNICPECLDKLKDTKKLLSDFILRYNQYCIFKNTVKGTEDHEITRETENNFISLFTPYSKVYNDLMEFPKVGSAKDYAAFVVSRFPYGIDPEEIEIVDVYLKRMQLDSVENEFEVELTVRKVLKSYITDKNKRVVAKKPGRTLDLDFTIRMSQDLKLSNVKIYKISGKEFTKKAKPKSGCILFGAAGLSLPQAKGHDNLTERSFQSNPQLTLGLGFNYFQTVGRKNRNYLTAGLKYSQLSMKLGTAFTSFTQGGTLGLGNINYTDSISFTDYTERFTLQQLEMMIGYMYTLHKGWRSELGLGLMLKPVWILGMESEINANYHFSQIIGTDKRAWCEATGELVDGLSRDNGLSGMRAYLSLAPYYEFDLIHASPFRLRLGAEFSFALLNWFSGDRQNFDSGIFSNDARSVGASNLNESSYRSGVIASLRPHYFDLQVGIVYRINQ